MLTYTLDVEQGSLWLRTTPSEFALKQPFYCTEAGIFYAGKQFHTMRDHKDSCLLFYTIAGCGIIRQNDVTIKLLPGQALFMDCRSPQSYYTDPDTGTWHHYWAHIDGTGISGLTEHLLPGQKISAMKTNREAVQSEFDNLLKNLENTSSDTILQTSLSIHTLLTGLVLRNTVSYSRSQELILQTADYIRAHYNEPIELDTLLAMAHMSKAWYMRLFRQYIGTTPYKYILTQRITKAREYLEVTDMTVHEIAMRTGFSDDASFSTRFSAMTGTSPLSYRKNSITYRQSQTKS